MKEQIFNIVVFAAPLVAGFITSVIIPVIIKKFTTRKLQEAIINLNEAKQIKDVKDELKKTREEIASVKREILEMRGKVK